MYLRKIENILIITEYETEVNRKIKLIKQLVNGNEIENEISCVFNESIFFDLIEYLIEIESDYKIDLNLEKIIAEHDTKLLDFELHSKKALEIKNKLNKSNSEFANFLSIINKSVHRKLYEHQAKAAYHMAFSLNSCNFSVPGTGKTTIVYSAYSYLKEIGVVDRLFIVGPLSSYYPWVNEYKECFDIEPDIMNLSSIEKFDKIKYLIKHHTISKEINFINYEGLESVKTEIKKFLRNGKVMLVLDEAHRIKNPQSKRTASTLNFSNSATSRIVLTGTPIPNGYQDLQMLFEFIWPKKEITGYSLQNLKKLSQFPNQDDVVKLMKNIDPFYVRIKKEYLHLPKPIQNQPIIVEMGRIQKEIYESLASDFLKNDYDSNDETLIFELKKAKLIRLMQASTNPSSIKVKDFVNMETKQGKLYNIIRNYEKTEIPAKYIVIKKLIEKIGIENENKKVIIWSTFVSNIISLSKYLQNEGYICDLLYGEVENDVRAEIIEKFHKDNSFKIIIANPAAVSESISLHKACHNAIYVDKNFNAAQFIQSKDRIHRVGLAKEDVVNYYYIFAKDSIDEFVHNRLLEKEKMMIDVIEGSIVPLFDQDFSSDLSKNDLKLIEEYFNRV